MKKYFVSALFLLGLGGFALYHHEHDDEAVAGTIAPVASGTPPSSGTPASTTLAATTGTRQTKSPAASAPSHKPAPSPVPVPAPAGKYRDGAYTGSIADAYYGYIQVRATVSGGKLSDVAFLQSPSDRRESIYINAQAMPYLKQEAIAAQSADVSGVSGATDTSMAFRESLASALAQAS